MATPSKELVEDICTRFILTAPAEEHQSFEHLMFLVEEAHWYYEDTVRDKDRHLKSYQLSSFTRMIFEVCPELSAYVGDLEDILRRFKEYKRNVPAMGAIILDKDMERVLLVKGYQSAACWGFPKGKISSTDATPAKCAIREVMEETGFDIEPFLKEEDCISKEVMGKRMKLYIIPGVDHLTTLFFPKCKGEIGAYAWHLVSDLPATYEEDKQLFVSMDGARHKFFTVWPFVKPLKDWISKKKARKARAGAAVAPGKAGNVANARSGTATNALFKNAVAAATGPGKGERDARALPMARSLSPPSGSSSGSTSPKGDLLRQLFGNAQAAVPDPAKRGAVSTTLLEPSGRSSTTSGTTETSPTAPSTPPPMTSSPKVYTAADLEGRIMGAVLEHSASGSPGQKLLFMLQEPVAGSADPAGLATAQPASHERAPAFWGIFKFDAAAILSAFD